jgi:hypothetical protein
MRTTIGTTGFRRRRWLVAVFSALLAATAVTAFDAAPAAAVHDTGAFELDGNATNNPAVAGDDWDNVCHQVLGTDCSTTSDTTGALAVDWVAEPNLNSTIFTGGGSKDPQDVSQWAWKDGAGGLPDKDNLLHSFAARYSLPSSSTCPSGTAPTCELLYFGSDRYDNSGDAQQGFWFFQNAITLGSNSVGGGTGFNGVHRAGDLLVISDFSNGGTTSTVTVYEWDPTCLKTGGTCGDANLRTLASSDAANCASAGAADDFCGIVNPTNGTTAPWSYTDKSGNNTYLQGEFYEGGVNLSKLGLADRCFASVASETRASTSTTATLKDFVLGTFGDCNSTVATHSSITGSTSIGTGSVSVSDTATVTVTGRSTWSGSLQFKLQGPIGGSGSAAETTQNIGSAISISQSTSQPISSATAVVTAVGDYCWHATFTSTTSGVPDATDDGTNECFTVTPVTPSLTTSAGPDVVLGNPVTDTATLSGTANQPGSPAINPTTAGAKAGGSISFKLLKGDCSTLATGTGSNPQSVSVSGDGTYGPVSFTPNAIGTYHWVATYTPATGDPNNLGSTWNGDCSDDNETVVVLSVASSMSTAQSFIPNDKATVSAPAGGNLAGSVTFAVFESSDCSGTAIYTQTVTVAGASPQTVSTTNTTVSTTATNVSWRVSYTSTNPAQRSIPASCVEKSTLTIDNDGTVTSP